MRLLDIHTHHIPSDDDHNLSVLNLFPEDYANIGKYHPSTLFSIGIHPWRIDNSEDKLRQLRGVLDDRRIVAVGEAGLDKFAAASMEVQMEVFKGQVLLSETFQKPMIIHAVRVWDKLIDVFEEINPLQPWILHGFRGKPELARRLAECGFYFSIGEFFNPESLKLIPVERLFCETDESLLPIAEIYRRIAKELNMDLEILAGTIGENFRRLFLNDEE